MAGIYKHRDGYKTYIIINSKRKYFYAKTQKDLDRIVTEQKNLLYKNMIVSDENVIFEKWAKKWLDLYKSNKSKATYNNYEGAIRLNINPTIGHLRLKDIRQIHIQDLLNKMDEKGYTRQIDIVLLTLKQIFEKAIENDYLYKNPTSGIHRKKHIAKEKSVLDQNTIRLINKIAKEDLHIFNIQFFLYTGIRKSEFVPIQKKDIDLINKTLTISKAVYLRNNKPEIKRTTNNETRKIPLSDILVQQLEDILLNKKPNEYVFTNLKNQIRTDTSMSRLIKMCLIILNKEFEKEQKEKNSEFKLTEDNQIKFSYHQLRHTFATILYKADIKLKEAQAIMGHKTTSILLDIYTHLDDTDRKISYEKLNNFITSG